MAETGHAERQRPHSMQSSKRSYASTPDGSSAARGNSLARSMGVRGEPLGERRHVDDEVGHHGEVRHGLDGDASVFQVGEACHAREPFAAVHPDATGPARRVEARVTDGERRVAVDLDPSEGVEDRARGFDLGLEDIEPRRAAVAREPEDAEVARIPWSVPAVGSPPRSRRPGPDRRHHHAAK